MEYHNHYNHHNRSISSSSTSRSPIQSHNTNRNTNTTTTSTTTTDPMQSWWESVSRARASIQSLLSLLPPHSSPSLSSIADSDRPARSLLDSFPAYSAFSASLSSPGSGSGDDPLCHWLYDTFVSSDSELPLVVLSFVPVIVGLYLSRVHEATALDPDTPSLAGFEAVILAVYAAEAKARGGKPVTVAIPDLSQPSLYHAPRGNAAAPAAAARSSSVGVVLCAPLEQHLAVKSTKRGFIVGVVLDCYYKVVSQMPAWSKVELCRFVAAWAGDDCPCSRSLDSGVNGYEDEVSGSCDVDDADGGSGWGGRSGGGGGGDYEIENAADLVGRMGIDDRDDNAEGTEEDGGRRIPLPWEILQPVLRIMGHCLLAPVNSQEVKDAAAVAVRRLYARASHDLVPEAILATRSLIQIDNRARAAVRAAVIVAASSKASTPTKAKKPEVLLASK